MGDYRQAGRRARTRAFQQLGDDKGEGGQADIKADIRSSEDAPSEEFARHGQDRRASFAKAVRAPATRDDEKR